MIDLKKKTNPEQIAAFKRTLMKRRANGASIDDINVRLANFCQTYEVNHFDHIDILDLIEELKENEYLWYKYLHETAEK